jgi:hypothetical protein
MEAAKEYFTPTCHRCGSTNLEEVDSLEPVVVGGMAYSRFAAMKDKAGNYSYLVEHGDKKYLCRACVAMDILIANNQDAARELERPATCHGCVHLEEKVCMLYKREFTIDPTPLTRFCYTWEL